MVFFSVTHWLFAFEYFKVSSIMPYAFDNENVPEFLIKRLDRLNKVFLGLVIFFTVVSGPLMAFFDTQIIKNPDDLRLIRILCLIDIVCYGILFFVTFVFLFIAVYRISK